MALLSKADIVSAEDLKTEEVKVPEWGGEVLVKTLSGTERDAFENSVAGIKNGKRRENYANFRARFVSHCMVDEAGNRLFVNDEDVKALGRKSVKALQRVFDKAQELNAMTDEDVEELTEDFDENPDENSTSD